MNGQDQSPEEPCKGIPILNANSATHYKHMTSNDKASLFEDLKAEIEKEKAGWSTDQKWIEDTARKSPAFIAELQQLSVEKHDEKDPIIALEDKSQRERFFRSAISPYPEVYWIDGCAAPTVND